MEDLFNLEEDVNNLNSSIKELQDENSGELSESIETSESLDSLTQRVKKLMGEKIVFSDSSNEEAFDSLQSEIDSHFYKYGEKTDADKLYDLSKIDILTCCFAGGISVLVDFLIVKIPNDMKFKNNGVESAQKGSELTKLFKKIGVTNDSKEAKWIKTLEKWFPVKYDPSIKDNIKGMYPKNHRIFSGGHDAGLTGFIIGIKDIVCGTFTYIDKNGILRWDKVDNANFLRICYAPFLWFGHILSDMFTRQGIPIPGACLLRTLQIGSFGDKQRTIAEIVEYMYFKGYDLRHMATMSTSKLVIDIILLIYIKLTQVQSPSINSPEYQKEYHRYKSKKKSNRMKLISYSIATGGNIAKVAAYNGNPNAINIVVWYEFVRNALQQIAFITSDAEEYIMAIENRNAIDSNFELLLKNE